MTDATRIHAATYVHINGSFSSTAEKITPKTGINALYYKF